VGGGEMPTRPVGGGEMPTRPVKLKKQMPMHVQDVLRQTSTRENPVDDLMRLDDFKGLGEGDMAASKTISNELYVKGLPFDLGTDDVRKLFLKAGHRPKSVRVLKDRKDNTRSLGFGFVGFKTEKDADAAMKAMQATALKSGHKGESTTKLSISKASAKGKERQMASRTKKTDFQHQVDIRKMQLSFDTRNKAVTSLDRMPRAYRVLADKNAKTKRELSEELAKGAEPEDEDTSASIGDGRAQAALDMFLKEGGAIEDVADEEFEAEVRAAKKSNSRTDQILYGDETVGENDEEDWFHMEDDDENDDFKDEEDGVDLKVARIEREEDERKNWDEYQRLQRINRENLHPGGETKASGALRSGQKKIKTWDREEPRE